MSNIYKCNVCGNVVTLVEKGGGNLTCCDQSMENIQVKNIDEGVEKHKPIIEKKDEGIIVKVGSIPHPMSEEHHIRLIQILKGDKVITGKQLSSDDAPDAEFIIEFSDDIKARAYCNVHGLWESE